MFANADFRREIELGVALPDEDPVACKNLETPSAGMLGSLKGVSPSPWWLNAGDPFDPDGVIVADMLDVCGATL